MTNHNFQSGDRVGWPRTGVNYDLLYVYGDYGWACPVSDGGMPITLDLTHEGLRLIDRGHAAAEADDPADNSDVVWESATEGTPIATIITVDAAPDVWHDWISPAAHARTIAYLINALKEQNA